jgi:hypothetical protein
MISAALARADYGSYRRQNLYSRYVSPRDLAALVPYWSYEEAEECARMVNYFSGKYSNMCRDPMYDFGDFVTLSYISVLKAKKNYEGKGKRLTPFMCRGYIQGYARREARKQEALRRLNVLLANGEYDWAVIFAKIEPYLSVYNPNAEEQAQRDDPSNVKRDLMNHILELAPYLYRFASDYFTMNGDEKKLKKKYGDTFSRQKKLFFKLSREFKRERDEDC